MIKVRGLVIKLSSERAFQAEGISSAKVLRKKQPRVSREEEAGQTGWR